jgi:hypothetical protein
MAFAQYGGLRSPYEQRAEGFQPRYVFTPRMVGRLACGELAVEPVLGPARVVAVSAGRPPNDRTSVYVGWRDEHGPGTAAGTYPADLSFKVRMPAHIDRLVIRQGIDRARWYKRDITADTARLIAAHLHFGKRSALYGFTVDGHVDDRLFDELDMVSRQRQYAREWVDAFARYCLARDDTGPLPAWTRRAVSEGEARAEAWLGAAGVNVGELKRQVSGNAQKSEYPSLLGGKHMETGTAVQLIEAAFALGVEAGWTGKIARSPWAMRQQVAA